MVEGRSLVGHLGFSNAVSVPQSRRTGRSSGHCRGEKYSELSQI
ncbi:hypothetical protein CSC30_5272 [Pseudomonas aeruginosa]|nr:hypothetical protein CSB90_5224 [Pseudomonas aeruginosa]AWF61805.1 hypothetical protein CSC30_5272 [Pseudomonas aeruginosa]AWZ85515.1 hypothetical protein CSC41_3269 [Pseudomonas aeruginosa]RCH02678.1 hypothetical protein CSC36_0690 [Pseudomonas aeruginosa]